MKRSVYYFLKDALDEKTYQRSVDFGEAIGKKILARAGVDNYPQSRGKPRFIGSNEPGKWHPTPPDYLDGVESCWGTMKTFAIDSGSQFMIPPPPHLVQIRTAFFIKQILRCTISTRILAMNKKQLPVTGMIIPS